VDNISFEKRGDGRITLRLVFKKMGSEGEWWMVLAQDCVQWWNLALVVLTPRFDWLVNIFSRFLKIYLGLLKIYLDRPGAFFLTNRALLLSFKCSNPVSPFR
jgi:hypothetical protein